MINILISMDKSAQNIKMLMYKLILDTDIKKMIFVY